MSENKKEAQKIDWGNEQSLQIDSYATGRNIVDAHLIDGKVQLQLTDGDDTWITYVQLPDGYKLRR